MAQNNYTPSQQSVIDSENCNLLVSAGAGSGKTTVLVEKATQQILNKKVALKELLIVTFTESASSEMKQRLGAKLSEYATDPVVANELENINNCARTGVPTRIPTTDKCFLRTVHGPSPRRRWRSPIMPSLCTACPYVVV